MLEFAWPLALVALPLPLLALWLLPPHRQRVSALRVPFFDTVVAAAGTEARSGAVVVRLVAVRFCRVNTSGAPVAVRSFKARF